MTNESQIIKDGGESKVLALNSQGLTYSQIAEETDYSYGQVRVFLLNHHKTMEDLKEVHVDIARELAKFESTYVKKWVREADATFDTLRARIQDDPTNKELASLTSSLARIIEVLGKYTHSFKAETEINVNQIKAEVRNQQFNLMYQAIMDWEKGGKIKIVDETFRKTCIQQAKVLNIGNTTPKYEKQPMIATVEAKEEKYEKKKEIRMDTLKTQLLALRKLKDEKQEDKQNDKPEEVQAND